MVVVDQEFCPECGDFVPALHDISGWCIPCSQEMGYRIPQTELVRYDQERQPFVKFTHCLYGHRYVVGSYYIRKDGSRRCKQCEKDYKKEKYKRQRIEMKDPNNRFHGTSQGVRIGCPLGPCVACSEHRKAHRKKGS